MLCWPAMWSSRRPFSPWSSSITRSGLRPVAHLLPGHLTARRETDRRGHRGDDLVSVGMAWPGRAESARPGLGTRTWSETHSVRFLLRVHPGKPQELDDGVDRAAVGGRDALGRIPTSRQE